MQSVLTGSSLEEMLHKLDEMAAMLRERQLSTSFPGLNVSSNSHFNNRLTPVNTSPIVSPSTVSSVSVWPVSSCPDEVGEAGVTEAREGSENHAPNPRLQRSPSLNPLSELLAGPAIHVEARPASPSVFVQVSHPGSPRPDTPPVDAAHPEEECQNRSSSPTDTGKKHELYYFRDGNVTFSVEGTLFRVHRFFFERDSALFRESILKDIDLHHHQNSVIELTGCTALDFERFLGVLYPAVFHEHTATTLSEWVSVLSLATQWGFDSIRCLAIREVYPLASPVDKIVLGHKYDVPAWLPGAYEAVCAREDPLEDGEAERMGAKDTARVARVREQIIRAFGTLDPRSPDQGRKLRALVKAEFDFAVETREPEPPEDLDLDNESRVGDSALPADKLAPSSSPQTPGWSTWIGRCTQESEGSSPSPPSPQSAPQPGWIPDQQSLRLRDEDEPAPAPPLSRGWWGPGVVRDVQEIEHLTPSRFPSPLSAPQQACAPEEEGSLLPGRVPPPDDPPSISQNAQSGRSEAVESASGQPPAPRDEPEPGTPSNNESCFRCGRRMVDSTCQGKRCRMIKEKERRRRQARFG